MKVCVFGLWHLGTVTAACLAAAGHEVNGLDFDSGMVNALAEGRPPLFEPGLEELVQSGLASGRLQFTTDPGLATADADVIWVAYDTPVDDHDRADVEYIAQRVGDLYPHVPEGAVVLVSSQVPVGTTRRLEEDFARESRGRHVTFGYSPENLRLGRAIAAFTDPDRIVVGLRSEEHRDKVSELLGPFTRRIEWMSVESAEMTKHALNAFLATSVSFINEIAAICERVGADAAQVARGLKSEARIGPRAYLSPGSAFAGGTLARDIVFLSQLGAASGLPTHLLSSVKVSNDAHRAWAQRRLHDLLGGVSGKTVAVWGLAYKPGTDTLRRSSSMELCAWLADQGATVRAHDPAIKHIPEATRFPVVLTDSAVSAIRNASALVVTTPWPEYRDVAASDVVAGMTGPLVLDANRFLGDTLGSDLRIQYLSVGRHTA